jgi:hypothetical protein
MKYLTIIALFSMLSFQLYGQSYNKKTLEIDYQVHQSNSNAFTFKNLRLYPIKANEVFLLQSKNLGKYTPLKEALETKKIVISETESANNNSSNRTRIESTHRNRRNTNSPQVRTNEINQSETNNEEQLTGSSATVNTLFVENISKDTVYLMAGEVIQGGKQDRVIAQDLILPPQSAKTELPVFCVEHGRWTYQDGKKSNFDKHYGGASMKLREVVDTKQNQSEVWKEVNRSNSKNKVESKTSAYTVQASSEEFQKSKKEYLNFFQNIFKDDKSTVGVIVVSGKKVVGCDMFASPQLFQSQYFTLLDSYINEAITDGEEVNISKNEVEDYMNKILNENEVEQEQEISRRGKIFKSPRFLYHISTYR